jgi:hypothetical protein
MEIREINVRSLDIPELPSYLISPTVSLPQTPPVTTLIGTPIIDIPGCVEAHESNNLYKMTREEYLRFVILGSLVLILFSLNRTG